MTSSEIRSALGAEPFRPFRLHFGSGRSIEVPRPGFVSISPSGRTATVYTQTSAEGDSFQIVDVPLVEAIELIRRGGGNGQRRRRAG